MQKRAQDTDSTISSQEPKRQKGDDTSNELLSLLECPVCMLCPMLPPIRQCPNGHALCDSCSATPACSACPQCRQHPTSIRNLVLEQLAKSLDVKCTNAAVGCEAIVKYSDIRKHMAECEFQPFRCPWCPNFGSACQSMLRMDVDAIRQHFIDAHKFSGRWVEISDRADHGWLERTLNFRVEQCGYCLFVVAGLRGIWQVVAKDGILFHVVQCFETKTKSSTHSFELIFEGGGMSVKWASHGRSLSENMETMIAAGECFIIHQELVRKVAGESQKYQVKIRVLP
mmetsp:Transcript_103277/g.332732  ORF Transcript_103277/g.332732 Transcript_103277/m.332732 type:complete len:284 (+) Transcript_103277:53-904(+)